MDNDEKFPRSFNLETPSQVAEFLDYLISDYSSDYNRPEINPESDWFADIVRFAESGAFWKATVLMDGEIIWTKKA